MKNMRARILLVFLVALAFSVVLAACSKQAGLKDEDAIKAVQTAIESNTQGMKLTSAITILEKGAKQPGGEFPYKVEYTVTMPDGSTKKQTVTYNISPGGVNDMGVNIWNAVEKK